MTMAYISDDKISSEEVIVRFSIRLIHNKSTCLTVKNVIKRFQAVNLYGNIDKENIKDKTILSGV